MKRALSFILAMAMLIGLLPSITFAADTVENPVYNFTVSAIADETIIVTDSKNTKSVQVNEVTDASQLRSDVSTGAWTHFATVGFATFALYSGNIQARVNPDFIDANGTVLKTSFAENATYSASVKYAKSTANGRTNIYFVPVSYATTKTWNMATADGINAAIADSANESSPVALAASVDMHTDATDANPATGNTFDVTAGDYYIILNITDDSAKGESDRYFSMISSLELTKQAEQPAGEIEEVDVTYSFTTGGRPDVTSPGYIESKEGVWADGYKSYPTAPTDPGQMWAYLGTTAEKAATTAAYVTMDTKCTGSGFTGANKGQFVAFKFRVPKTGKYTVTDFKALKYKNASELMNIYIIPMDETVFSEGNSATYGTVADADGDGYYNRTGKKSTDVATENDIVASTNICQSTAEYSSATLTATKGIDLEKGKDYVLLFAHDYTSSRAITPSGITLHGVCPKEEEDKIPGLDGEVDSFTYSFTKNGRSDTSGTWFERVEGSGADAGSAQYSFVKNEAFTSLPASSKNPADNWAYVGTNIGLGTGRVDKTSFTGNFISVDTYVGANKNATNEWIAFKIKAPYTTKYSITGGTAYKYKNATANLEFYITPATDALNSVFGNSATYGSAGVKDLSGNYYGIRTGAAAFADLGISADALMGCANLYNATVGLADIEITDGKAFELEKNKEYYLILNAKEAGAPTIATLEMSYEVPPLPVFDEISADFGEVFVGTKLAPSVKWLADGEEIDGTLGELSLKIKDNSEDALYEGNDGNIYAVKEGKATVTVTGKLSDITKSVDVGVEVMVDNLWSGVSTSYLFYSGAYTGEGAYSVTVSGAGSGDAISKEDFLRSTALDYSEQRPWALVAAKASRPNSGETYFPQNTTYMDFSANSAGEWVALKVKVPAAGKYAIDFTGYTYASGGLAKIYMLPYTTDMDYDNVTANIASYMSDANFVGEADLYNSPALGAVNYPGIAQFNAAEGVSEYLMIVESARSKKGSKAIVMPYGIYFVGAPALADTETSFSYLTIGVGESTSITGFAGKNSAGNVIDTSEAYIEYSLAEVSEEILEVSEDGKTFTAKKEGKATVITKTIMAGSIVEEKNTITVDDSVGIANAYIYATKAYDIGSALEFDVRLEQSDRKVISEGTIVKYEIVEQDDGVLELSDNDTVATVKGAGTAKIKAYISARGKIFESDTLTLTFSEFAGYPASFKLDFRTGSYSGITAIDAAKEYTSDRNWIFHSMTEKASFTSFSFAKAGRFTQLGWNSSGITSDKAYIAFKAQFSKAGPYTVESVGYCRDRSACLELYLIPTSVEDGTTIASKLVKDNEYYFGTGEHYLPQNPGKYDYPVSFGTNEIDTAGEYFVVFKPVVGDAFEKYTATGGDAWYISYISFNNGNAMTSASMTFEKSPIEIDETIAPVVTLYNGTGTEIKNGMAEADSIVWKTSNSSVATVDQNGTVTGVAEGTAQITAVVTHGGVRREAVGEIKVLDSSGIDTNLGLTLEADKKSIYVYGVANLSVVAAMNSGKYVAVPSEYITWEITSGEEFIELEQSGRISGVDMGTATVKASVSAEWKEGVDTFVIEPIEIVVGWDTEVDPQIYTMEERKNAIKNADRYAWARDDVKAIKEKGDKWVENLDWLYENMVPEGLPRYYHVGHKYDPKKFFCRYCNANIGLDYGSYAWAMNPMQDEWKIQCPSCKRKFPSNDFGSFYELGLSDNGTAWSYDKALQKHHELFVCEDGETCTHKPLDKKLRGSEEWYTFYGYGVESGYLTNDLYSDSRDSRWGVDDSLGYLAKYDPTDPAFDTSYVEGEYGLANYVYNGAKYPVQHTYIAYYIHEGIWYGAGSVANSALVKNAISDLRLAFAYTGEAKYGRAGAILLDRLADMYPHFDWYQWHDFRGDAYRGNIADPVWSTGIAQTFAEAYDSFKPIYNDPYVVEYLSKNGAIYEEDENGNLVLDNGGNPIPVNLKDSPGAVRKNAEDNILITIYNDTLKGKIWGNFGMHQSAVVVAAVALNRMPETGEMLEWIMRDGTGYNTGAEQAKPIAGGYVMKNLIEEVDRDGIGNENAPGYNRTWITNLIEIAKYLADYEGYDGANLFENPKFVKMFPALVRLTLGGYYCAQIGDSGAAASSGIVMNLSDSLTGFKYTGNRMLAQAIYLYNGNTTDGIYGSILDDDPEQLAKDIEKIIEEDGELALDSDMLTGFGFAVLRAGANNKSSSSLTATNTIRDMAIYYGANTGHGHFDTLNLFMSAFGLNIAPDLGYPEQTGSQPNRMEWIDAAISHNTVIVDEKEQGSMGTPGTPYHFDDAGRVKLMDVAADVYSQTDEYRRSVVMVEVDDENSYGVDFFHVNGGNDHLYSFHSQSDELTAVSGLDDLYTQPMYTDENGDLYGVYAGADVKYGPDPGGVTSGKYPHGYTWLRNVRTFNSIDNKISVEWNVKDWNKKMTQNRDVRLRLTMVSDEPVNEVTFASALPPQTANNKNIGELEYLLVRREGQNLDTTFTTVLEPYENGKQYIDTIEKVAMERAPGVKPGLNDAFSAVKVTLKTGRIDYVIYSNNNEIDYIVDNKINFRGFAGVVSLESIEGEEKIIYKYLNDGEVLDFINAESTEKTLPAYTGKIKSFTDELAMENYITYTPDAGQNVDVEALAGKYVYVNNDGVQNGAYKIEKASENADGDIVLDIGMVSPVRSFVDAGDMSLGYVFNIKDGQTLRIPLSDIESSAPVFDAIEDRTATAGSTISFGFNAESPVGKDITFVGTSLPRGMTIDAENQTITWKPDGSQIGENHVAITADDGTMQTTVHFYITVYGSTTGGTSGQGSASNSSTGTGSTGTDSNSAGSGSTGTDSTGSGTTGTDSTGSGTAGETTSGEVSNVRFIDLENYAWAADSINTLADEGIVKGTTANTYSPAANITRADFAILLVRAFELESDDVTNFDDVDVSDYFASELAIARNTGIVNGIGDNKYAPRNTITRQDMILITYRALQKLGVELETGDVDYPDFDEVEEYAQDAVRALIASGIVNGKNGYIDPTANTTRAEVAVLLKRILEYAKK